jgi:hypothetical protein
MMEWTGMHRHRSVRQIAYKIRISSTDVQRKSSRAARRHRAKVLPKCETIITIPCAVGERRAAVFRCSALLSRCYVPRFFGRKAMYVSVLAERARENAGYQRRVCCSGPRRVGQEPRMSAGLPPRFAANPLHLQQKGRHRPAGDRDRRCFTLAANPLQMQPDGARARSVARQLRDGNTPNSAMHCVKGKPVALKIGFAVGSAKLVVPLPP